MGRDTKRRGHPGEHKREPAPDLDGFDYNAAAELFMSFSWRAKNRPKYMRFDTAAEAVRFVVENLPAAILPGAYLLIDEARFGVEEIRSLYERSNYPLPRSIEKF
jgi:hypothetical protein